jgi:flagellar FliL protein
MSAATATANAKAPKATDATEVTEAPPAKGKKKLIIIIAVAVLALVLVGGGAAWFLLKKKPAEADAEGDDPAATHVVAKKDKAKADHGAPVFVPLDPFTVNLADREAERYAQIGITLEIEDSHVGDKLKTYMPAIRNNILMAISDHTAADLMGREGKTELAERVKREVARALGIEVEEPHAAEAGAKPARKAKKGDEELPVKAVHFSNFIIQ